MTWLEMCDKVNAGTLPGHQMRVFEEKEALDYKIDKLYVFINIVDGFKDISVEEQTLAKKQYEIMKAYSQALTDRIGFFSTEP